MYRHIIIQSPDDLKPKIKRLLTEGLPPTNTTTNTSLSRIFRHCRKDQRVSNFGDYPLLAFIINYSQEVLPEHKWTRRQIIHALKFCRFWEEEGRKRAYIPEEWKDHVKD